MFQSAMPMANSSTGAADDPARAINRSVQRCETLQNSLVLAPYLLAALLPVLLVSSGWLSLIWGLVLAALLSVGAAQAHAWLNGSVREWLLPQLLHGARVRLHLWLVELGGNSALVHSWTTGELGGIALTDSGLLVAVAATGFEPLAIAFADIAKIQLLRGTIPNMLVLHYRDPQGANCRQYLLFPELMIAELWNRELQARLAPAAPPQAAQPQRTA